LSEDEQKIVKRLNFINDCFVPFYEIYQDKEITKLFNDSKIFVI